MKIQKILVFYIFFLILYNIGNFKKYFLLNANNLTFHIKMNDFINELANDQNLVFRYILMLNFFKGKWILINYFFNRKFFQINCSNKK